MACDPLQYRYARGLARLEAGVLVGSAAVGLGLTLWMNSLVAKYNANAEDPLKGMRTSINLGIIAFAIFGFLAMILLIASFSKLPSAK